MADRGDYAVKIFDQAGRYLGHLGGRGDKTGEFLLLADAQFIDDSTVVAIDVNRQTLTLFNVPQKSGEWTVRTEVAVPLRPMGTLAVAGDSIIVGGIGPWQQESGGSSSAFRALHVYDQSGSLLRSLLDRTTLVRSHPGWGAAAAPYVVSNQSATRPEITVVHMFGEALVKLNHHGQVLHDQRIPEVGGFSARKWGKPGDDEAANGSAIVSLTGGARLLMGYVATGEHSGKLRYDIFDGELNLLATGLSGPRVLGRNGDTLLALSRGTGHTGEATIEFLSPCSNGSQP